jgi:SPX domain protein involved in polyphosphate accumulation
MNENRIEKKFVLGKFKDDFFKKFLLVNGFTKQYPDRTISSIYLDTANYDFAKDNINGVSERKKIRFRWYNNNLDDIYVEEKNKRNFNVWKNIEKISLPNNKKSFLENLKEYFDKAKFKNMKNFNYKFVLKTNYERSYWLLSNNKIRATIDIDINTSSMNNFSKPIYLGDTVLEFKFHPLHEEFFRDFFSKRFDHLRTQKYSKYVRSFIELENSGLNY